MVWLYTNHSLNMVFVVKLWLLHPVNQSAMQKTCLQHFYTLFNLLPY